MKRFALALSLILSSLPALGQGMGWVAGGPNQSIPFNNYGLLGWVNWTNGCILQYQTGTAIGATGGYPVCLTSLGSSTTPMTQGYFTNINTGSVTALTTELDIIAAPGGAIDFAAGALDEWRFTPVGNFIPMLDNTYLLGGPGYRVSDIYTVGLGDVSNPVLTAYITALTLGAIPTLPSQTANTFFAAPNGSAGAPSFRAIVAADLPAALTLNSATSQSGHDLLLAATGCQNVDIGVNSGTPWIFGCIGTLVPDTDNTRNFGGPTQRIGIGYFGALGASGTPVTNSYVTTENVKAIVATGTAPTNSGSCAINTQSGGNAIGSFKANGACVAGTIILTFATAAPNDWSCTALDVTTPADTIKQSNTTASTTTATFTATLAASDLVRFQCFAF